MHYLPVIRDLLQNKMRSPDHEAGVDEGSTRQVTMSTETDHRDDGFDLAHVEITSETLSSIQMETNDDWTCPAIHHGECFSDRRSTFQSHLTPVFHKSQIKKVLTSLLENKKIANAAHNIFAYRIMQQQGSHSIVIQGCEDDWETHAGSRMLHLLQENLDELQETWNTHVLQSKPISIDRGRRPIVMYTIPELYQAEDHLCPADETEIMICAEETVPKTLTCADDTLFDLCMMLMEENRLLKPNDSNEARHLYVRLRELIRLGLSRL